MLRWIYAFLFLIFTTMPIFAQDQASSYTNAAKAFATLPLERRIVLQTRLTAAGYWPNVPNSVFGKRLFAAITQFQTENGFEGTGILASGAETRLAAITDPLFARWAFRPIAYPGTNIAIWVPMGLGLTATRERYGLKFTNNPGGMTLNYEYFSNTTLEETQTLWQQVLAETHNATRYAVKRRDFFVISADRGTMSTYIRAHPYRGGVLFFTLIYNSADTAFLGDRIQTLISASFWSTMSRGAPAIPLPGTASVAMAAPQPAPAPRTTPSAPASTPAPPDASSRQEAKISSGTAFFVDTSGHLMTNAHVIEGCTQIAVNGAAGNFQARLVARDATNDLALLKADASLQKVPQLRTAMRLGENVAAFGYPLSGLLSTSGNFTLGNVTALTGLADDTRYFQISTPVQPGNSGGPLLDGSGNIVGIVSAKLNALKAMEATNGDIAQNVNFAIKASLIGTFLESKGVQLETTSALGPVLSSADIAERAQAASVHVQCH